MIKVIDDFLSKDEFETLKGYVFHPHFPLYLQDEIVDEITELRDIFDGEVVSSGDKIFKVNTKLKYEDLENLQQCSPLSQNCYGIILVISN